ncbi:sigma factor-like helix-turn-helix DNA-binding protein [Streptomyces sp. NPDC096311]|uniref:sigma factor-like helix-turn-helix DNA-binding protein n=1 Tax=Streptomyces sp. NPDC096311 TaxID=3366083 RepID=UPI0038272801
METAPALFLRGRRPAAGASWRLRFRSVEVGRGRRSGTHRASRPQSSLLSDPPPRRLAVYLADVEGLSYREIAETMGTRVGTVMSRIHRGRRQLRWLLPQYTPGLHTA